MEEDRTISDQGPENEENPSLVEPGRHSAASGELNVSGELEPAVKDGDRREGPGDGMLGHTGGEDEQVDELAAAGTAAGGPDSSEEDSEETVKRGAAGEEDNQGGGGNNFEADDQASVGREAGGVAASRQTPVEHLVSDIIRSAAEILTGAEEEPFRSAGLRDEGNAKTGVEGSNGREEEEEEAAGMASLGEVQGSGHDQSKERTSRISLNTDAVPEPPPGSPVGGNEDKSKNGMEGALSNSALNVVWSFGININVPLLNLTDVNRTVIMYCSSHIGILYNYRSNRQRIIQGHANAISCTCVSDNKRWLATADMGKDCVVNLWDTYSCILVQTIFQVGEYGIIALTLTADAKYLATLSADSYQVFSIWNWTVDGETPICSCQLDPIFEIQHFIRFSPDHHESLVSNSDHQAIFYYWAHSLHLTLFCRHPDPADVHEHNVGLFQNIDMVKYFTPPLTDQDFNKSVGKYSQSLFLSNTTQVLTATSIGNLVVWDNNKKPTEEIFLEPWPDKKPTKIIKVLDVAINVLTADRNHIVIGDQNGNVRFFDQQLRLLHWYDNFEMGPVNAISFSNTDPELPSQYDVEKYPSAATIAPTSFMAQDFIIGTTRAMSCLLKTKGSVMEIIHREHNDAIHAVATHPTRPYLAMGSYSGLFKVWEYKRKIVSVSRQFIGSNIQCCAFNSSGTCLAIGMLNGVIHMVDAITLKDELNSPFHYTKNGISHLAFSHDFQYLVATDTGYSTTLFKRNNVDTKGNSFLYMARFKAHYKPIKDIVFGIDLDTNAPRLLSLGEDRMLIEYDLQNSDEDDLRIMSMERIEQSAIPLCMVWYPSVTEENFFLIANDQYKFKLYNTATIMCRKVLLGPFYGSPVQKIVILPYMQLSNKHYYLGYITDSKVGLSIIPLDGNPNNCMAVIAHPGGVCNLACSFDAKYLFTAGGIDRTVHMWEINTNALEAQAKLGGENLVPYYALLEGGRGGELFKELEDYFYYAMLRNQGINAMETRKVSDTIPISEIPYVMRAIGYYPTEQEIGDMLTEVKFSVYVETGKIKEEINLGDFIKLYINHRPFCGLTTDRLLWAFNTLGFHCEGKSVIERNDLLNILQNRGEHMTESELTESLVTLLGFNAEGGTSELQEFDENVASGIIEDKLPEDITAEIFSRQILGFPLSVKELSISQVSSGTSEEVI